MDTKTVRTLTLVAGLAWLVVAGYGVRTAMVDEGDGWRVTYAIFNLALLVGVTIGVVLAAWVSQGSVRPRLRMAGLVVAGVGGLASIGVAWALPLWMPLLGAGWGLVAIATAPRERRAVALLAAGQIAGLAVMFAGLLAEIGRRDEYGDYPAAGGIALVVTGLLTLIALFELAKALERRPVENGSAAPTLGANSIA